MAMLGAECLHSGGALEGPEASAISRGSSSPPATALSPRSAVFVQEPCSPRWAHPATTRPGQVRLRPSDRPQVWAHTGLGSVLTGVGVGASSALRLALPRLILPAGERTHSCPSGFFPPGTRSQGCGPTRRPGAAPQRRWGWGTCVCPGARAAPQRRF